jgi:hypothetical protein
VFTQQWYLALLGQGCIALAALFVAVTVLRIPARTALLGALFLNSIPVTTAPGFRTELFIHDLIMPILLLMVVIRFARMPRGIFGIALVAIFLWPLVGVLLGLTYRAGGYSWITFLYRRFGLLVFLLAGAAAFRDLRVRDLFDTYVLVWIGMAVVGLAQYFGLINVDFVLTDIEGESIVESAAAQRGFLGLHRNTTGILSALMLAYCVTHLVLARRVGSARTIAYASAIPLTVGVLLFSGSRTGALASLAGVGYVCLAALPHVRQVRAGRVVVLGIIAAAAVLYVVTPALTTVRTRLDIQGGAGALATRTEIQKKVLEYTVKHAEAGLAGMGFGTGPFRVHLGTSLSHAHSEYMQVLWCSGWPGLILYLLFVYRVFSGMKPRHGAEPDVSAIATRGMFVAGLVAGLTVGNLLVSAPYLYTYGMCMLLVYGAAYRRGRRRAAEARAAPILATPAPARAGLGWGGASGENLRGHSHV